MPWTGSTGKAEEMNQSTLDYRYDGKHMINRSEQVGRPRCALIAGRATPTANKDTALPTHRISRIVQTLAVPAHAVDA